MSQDGWQVSDKTYKKFYDRVKDHESSECHTSCFAKWKILLSQLKKETGIDDVLIKNLKSQQQKWEHVFRAILDVILFLSERGLALRGSVEKLGSSTNGNFLGILELLAKRDPLLNLYLDKVKSSQDSKQKLRYHYLSPTSQNEFLNDCGTEIRKFIVAECSSADFFSIIVDATPDSGHLEQQTFILRYLKETEIKELFLQFISCAEKTGEDISNLILKELERHGLQKDKLRGQGYDNGSNMAGKFKGCQARILEECPLAVFSSCSLHTLNLVGVDAAKSCPSVVTFFGTVQKLYKLFSGSPKRWEVLKSEIGDSLHGQSETRWTARVASVKPFAAHLSGLLKALDGLNRTAFPSLTSANLSDIRGLKAYLSSYTCILMSSVWFKILKTIDIRNQIIQRQNCSLDVAVKNMDALLSQLKDLREKFEHIVDETSHVARAMGIKVEFPRLRHVLKLKIGAEEATDKERFKHHVFYLLMDHVIGGLTERFRTMNSICKKFSFLWTYNAMTEEDLSDAAEKLGKEYQSDLNPNLLVDDMIRLKTIHEQTFGKKSLTPLKLFQELHDLELVEIFSECMIALKIFLTIPVSVASGERSFSKLKLIKSDIRSTMSQDRLNNLSILNMNSDVAKKVDFRHIIKRYAYKQATRNSSFF